MPRSTTDSRSLQIALDAEARAERELADYYARRPDQRRRDGWRETVEAVLAVIPAYHRGVLSLHYTARSWPEPIQKAFGRYASLAIRLDCCDHPAQGATSTLEAGAAERLVALVAETGSAAETLTDLRHRACDHHDRAVHAYAKARAKHPKPTSAQAEMDQAAE